jgi:hypothetical protein
LNLTRADAYGRRLFFNLQSVRKVINTLFDYAGIQQPHLVTLESKAVRNKTIWISTGFVVVAATLLIYLFMDGGVGTGELRDTSASGRETSSLPVEGQSNSSPDTQNANGNGGSQPRPDDREPSGVPLVMASNEVASNEAVFLQSHVSAPSKQIQQELIHVDPTVDGWDTEAFSEQASQQLKLLAAALRNFTTDSFNSTTQQLLHEDFRCVALRPSSRRTVFRDARLAVERWEWDRRAPAKPENRQVSGFQTAIKALVAAWEPSDEPLRASFKIVRVTPSQAHVRTRVLVQLAGSTKDGYVQQNAVRI